MLRYIDSITNYYSYVDRVASEWMDLRRPEYLLKVDPEAYLDQLVRQVCFQKLAVLWDEMTVEPFKTAPPSARHERRWVGVEMFRVRIPTEPNPDRKEYFHYRASKERPGSTEPDWNFDSDTLVMEVRATEEAVTKLTDDFKFYTDCRNEDIDEGHSTLRERLAPVWWAKRKQLEEQAATSQDTIQRLGVKLYRKANAPAPISVVRRQLSIPKTGAQPPAAEPTLSDGTVEQLVAHLSAHGRQLETAPGSYAELPEETLRNIILGSLNASFSVSGTVTGTAESFSKLGKTDIQLKVNGHVPLVIECKFWKGPKDYLAALAQLFDYITWRQGHAVLLHFSKTQDLTASVMNAMDSVAAEPTIVGQVVQKPNSSFVSRHKHPQDEGKAVDIHHLFFDLSLSPQRTRRRGKGGSE